ncbi:FecR family protein [Chitinophaga qingshengii]|uniref:FecR domain-containing protein n=1 Tax=Chitinophaga qingshengii TaxID=1569794 RepID=A0ABR7TFS7_9BACT|nr:FecR domain-containing protein [Chitinophaga qingshengii]MBC9929236.1 FecR domain-containing protein [Chitinophaga qingshengii]
MQDQRRLNFLTQKVIANNITEEERTELLRLLADPGANQVYEELFNELANRDSGPENLFSEQEATALWGRVQTENTKKTFRLKAVLAWSAAASIAAVSFLSYNFLVKDAEPGTTIVKTEKHIDEAPFIQSPAAVTLTLSDGKQVTLDSSGRSQVFTQPGAHAVNNNTGVLVYEEGKGVPATPVITFNTLSTPRGKTYKVVLPDGSRVWLNAASALHYPTLFSGKERKVELTGEAYFDIVKDAGKPFVVVAGKQSIAVLGTAFNVKAYTDEAYISTTLVEGSIKVDPGNSARAQLLQPGEQATLEHNQLQVRSVDIQQEISWKSDLFHFSNTDLQVVAHQLQRWYDIEVDFSTLPSKKLYGQLPRSTPLPQLLRAIEKTSNIKLELVNNRLLAVE